ncbi:hypothetical protein [Streptomyces sp. NPDC057579]|uniref:hypothetical protein n=1 Tax=unclassified Streptomyces TaxID=2593676 RepID=UPI00369FCAC1
MRLHDSGKRLFRQVARDEAVVQSVTVSRGEHRWYASVLCKVTLDVPDRASRAQAERGEVGVDIGVKVLAALSKPLGVWAGGRRRGRDADRQSAAAARRAAARRLVKAQRALSQPQKGSVRWEKARRRVGRFARTVDGKTHAWRCPTGRSTARPVV